MQDINDRIREWIPDAKRIARRLCKRRYRDEAQADALVGLWVALRSYDPERGVLRTWVYRKVAHAVIDGTRRRISQERFKDILRDYCDTHPVLFPPEEFDTVADLVLCLPEVLRETMVLYFADGLEQRQIAQRYGVAPSLVSWRIKRALEQLRRKYLS